MILYRTNGTWCQRARIGKGYIQIVLTVGHIGKKRAVGRLSAALHGRESDPIGCAPESSPSLRSVRDSREPLRSIGRLLSLWRLYRWGWGKREILLGRASVEGGACCGRRAKNPSLSHHFFWFLQRRTMSGAAWRQWGGLRLGRNPAEAESSTADNCFASRPVHTASCRGRPITGLEKASFAYFWTPWPKSKSRRRSETLWQSSRRRRIPLFLY
jgi:hypothetical protein